MAADIAAASVRFDNDFLKPAISFTTLFVCDPADRYGAESISVIPGKRSGGNQHDSAA
jgi:hypothetical protein